MSKEKPIPLTTQEVLAILDGRKTMIRKIIKLPSWSTKDWNDFEVDENEANIICTNTGCMAKILCPYGKFGDVLWVRETWARYQTVDYARRPDGRSFSEVSDGRCAYKADGFESIEDLRDHIRLMSDCGLEAVEIEDDKWKPSIFMPRSAARIFLKVTNVRVERLQDITEEDAISEGIPQGILKEFGRPIGWFKSFWDSLNVKRGYGWDLNPWVFVIEFEVIKK